MKSKEINEPVTEFERLWHAHLVTDSYGRGESVPLGDDEVEQYNAGPDLFAAHHFGFESVEDYHEWVACNGAPLCSERTKGGTPCRGQIGSRYHYSPREWLAAHRSRPCAKHGGPPEGEMPPTLPHRRSRYPARDDRRCQAVVEPLQSSWNHQAWSWGSHQCGLPGTFQRDGKRVCHVHRDCVDVAFSCDGGAS